MYLTKLRLSNFRNSTNVILSDFAKINYIYGQNGVGKTNILDAISRFISSSGLKYQSSKYCVNMTYPHSGWSIDIKFGNNEQINSMRTGMMAGGNTRIIKYCDKNISLDMAKNYLPLLWLTPIGESVFMGENSVIRRYFNDIISLFYNDFYEYYNLVERAQKQRLKILLSDNINHKWLDAIEYEMAQNAVILIRYYDNFIDLVNKQKLLITPEIYNFLPDFDINYKWNDTPTSDIAQYANLLKTHRHKDKISGRTSFGINNLRWNIRHIAKNIDIAFCSTGEQKAVTLLILMIVNNTLISNYNIIPIILLDDAYAHFDRQRINYIDDYIMSLPNQFFLTGTEFTDNKTNNLVNYFKINADFMGYSPVMSLF